MLFSHSGLSMFMFQAKLKRPNRCWLCILFILGLDWTHFHNHLTTRYVFPQHSPKNLKQDVKTANAEDNCHAIVIASYNFVVGIKLSRYFTGGAFTFALFLKNIDRFKSCGSSY